MKSYDEVINLFKKGQVYPRYLTHFFNDLDLWKLCMYIKSKDLQLFGFMLKENENCQKWDKKVEKKWKRKNFIKELKKELGYAFDKMNKKEGLAVALIIELIKMWLWILDDDLWKNEEFEPYGLPFLEKVALKYKFNKEV